MTLEDYLAQDARLYPEKVAAICGDCRLTYHDLWQRVQEECRKYRDVQEKVIPFRSSQDIPFLITYFAIHLSGHVAAPIDRDCPEGTFHDICQKMAAVGAPEECADILYTTGTTGKAKGVMAGHHTIIANAENLIGAQRYSHDLTFIVSGPLNHIGSLSKLYPVILTGGTLHILDGMKDMNAFLMAMKTAPTKVGTFLVPAHIRMLTQLCRDQLAMLADKIDFIETGAAPISLTDMQRLCQTLPKSRLYNTYASTETGIIATYDYNEGECVAGCLGRPMAHSRILITEDGHIACQGDTLMLGYANDSQLTRQVLHDNTLYTADLGYLDAQGRLHLSGREDDVINVGGYKVSPVEVEDAAKTMPMIEDCICIAADHPMMGKMLKLLVVLGTSEALDKRKIAQYLNTQLESYKVPLFYQQVDKIERTFNGKLNRKFYVR